MKPENHAIRQLEGQLDAASPEVADAIVRVIAALNTCIMNSANAEAMPLCRRGLEAELATLEKLKSKK